MAKMNELALKGEDVESWAIRLEPTTEVFLLERKSRFIS